jgi:uncharacterized protein YodC (DUF2158 family)
MSKMIKITKLPNGGIMEEFSDGTKYWYLNDKFHREDGPAIEYISGTKAWHLNGNLHREDGPAVEFASGHKEWWINNKQLSQNQFEQLNLNSKSHLDDGAILVKENTMHKQGDVVELKSGGPRMTIERIERTDFGIEALCSWFLGDGEIRQAKFFDEALKKVKDE